MGAWNIAPSEFWGMSHKEFFKLVEAKSPKTAGANLSDEDLRELYEMLPD